MIEVVTKIRQQVRTAIIFFLRSGQEDREVGLSRNELTVRRVDLLVTTGSVVSGRSANARL